MEEVSIIIMQQGGLCHHHPLRHGKLTLPWALHELDADDPPG